jgi:hypothetical protein
MRRTRAAARLAVLTTLVLAGVVPAAIVGDAASRAAVTVHTVALKCSVAPDDVGTVRD